MLPFFLLNTRMLKIETPFAKNREIAEQRLSICKECPRYVEALSRCRECGCFMKAKALWPSAACPLGKWGPHKGEK